MPKQSAVALAKQAQRQDTVQRARVVKAMPAADAAQATVDSFVNFAHKLGIGGDNALSTATYGFNPLTRNRTVLEWMYRGSWIAGMAVDIIADDMTRRGIDFKTELPPEQIEKIDQASVLLGTWSHIGDVIRWSRLYGGCLGVVLVDGQDLSTPLRTNTVGVGDYKGLAVLDRWMVEPSLNDLVTDFGPCLGLPKYYTVLANAPSLRGQRIHYTRVAFRLIGIPLPYQQQLTENLWGLSIYERIYDRMTMFDSATTGAGQLVYKSYLRTLKVKGLRLVVASGGRAQQGLAAYADNMRRYQGIEGLTMIDAEDDLEAQSHSAFSGLSDVITQLGQQLSGALGIPMTRMFGDSPGGLNATGEGQQRTYDNTISQQQQRHLQQGVHLVYDLTARSAGVPLPDGASFGFRPLYELSEAEKATVANNTADAVTKASDAGLISSRGAMQELRQSSRVTGIFSNITQADIAGADDRVNPPPDPSELVAGLLGQHVTTQQQQAQQQQQEGGENGKPGSERNAGPVPGGTRDRVRVQKPVAVHSTASQSHH